MDELERMLQGDPARLGPVDSHAVLAGVMARGRRLRVRRRAVRLGASTAAAVAAVAIMPLATAPGVTVDDVAGPDGSTTTTSASDAPSSPQPTSPPPSGAQAVEPRPEPSTEPLASPSATSSPTPPRPTPERVPLTLTVTTDDDRYAQGTDVTIVVRACNDTDRVHEEWFADRGRRFRVQVITADDRNIAFGQYARVEATSTEVWQAGECHDYTLVWDQSEGPFEEDGGQQAWEGEHRIELSWWGGAPPPDGMDPGLYDPVGRDPVWSAAFTIEPPEPEPTPLLSPVP